MATSLAADLHKNAKKDAEISSLKIKLRNQRDQQKKTLKLRKEHEQEKTKIIGQSSKLILTTKKLKTERKKF